jgi:tetratricopeptide (TPR) repeat protein
MKDNKIAEDFDEELENTEQTDNSVNAFVQKNGKMIVIISVAVIVLVGLILLFKSNSQKNEENAMIALSRVETYYFQGDYENALFAPDSLPTVRDKKVIGLVKIVNEYGSTKAGERATLFAADAYFNLGKFPDAKIYYEKAIQSKNNEIKVGGYAGSAACNEKDGKLKDAAANYLKAVNLINDEGLKLRYLYFAGLCSEKTGEKNEAKKIYRQIINLNKFSEFNNMAKAGIVRLGEDVE